MHLEPNLGAPELPPTLWHALEAAESETQHGLIFHSDREVHLRTWSELAKQARSVAAALMTANVSSGTALGIMLAEPQHFVPVFLGALACRALPFAIGPQALTSDRGSHLERVARALEICGCEHLICDSDVQGAQLITAAGRPCILRPHDLAGDGSPAPYALPGPDPDEVCLLQLTSGSTRDPRAVAVTHRNLVENVRATHAVLASGGQSEVGVSWLPLWHDMGLIAALVTPLLARNTHVVIAPQAFAMSPRIWLEALHRYQATVTATTNFGLHLALKRLPRAEGFHLRSLRAILVGAEPINPQVLRAFERQFAPYGLSPGTLCPAYGMAETTLASSVTSRGRAPTTLAVDKTTYECLLQVRAPQVGSECLEIVSCGTPLPSHRVAILDKDRQALADGAVGQVAIGGPSLTPGYYSKGCIEPHELAQGMFLTGDLGFIRAGELFISGRAKDLIVIAGRNLHPQLVEWCVGRLEGVRTGSVAAFSVPGTKHERLVVAVEGEGPRHALELPARIRACIARDLGVGSAAVVVVPSWTMPRTTSGKIRRHKVRELFLAGDLVAASAHDDLS